MTNKLLFFCSVMTIILSVSLVQASECTDNGGDCQDTCDVYSVNLEYECCMGAYDENCDDVLDSAELQNAIEDFFQTQLTFEGMMENLGIWGSTNS